MSELTIQISIAGKNYPLSIKASEEASIRKSEAQLEEAVSLFQKNYSVKDRGDLLAMAALQIITKLNNTPAQVIEKEVAAPDYTEELSSLEQLVAGYLAN